MTYSPGERVLAIDPGPEQSAFVVWDGEQIISHGKHPNAVFINGGFVVPKYRVIEMVASYGKAVGATTFETVFWIGRFFQYFSTYREPAWQGAQGPIPVQHIHDHCDRLVRRDVKMHLCESNAVKDSNIRQALIDRFGPPGKKAAPGVTYKLAGDTWQAFALAVTWWDKR